MESNHPCKGGKNMKRFLVFLAAFFVVGIASALACHEMVHVADNEGNPMEGVVVNLSTDCMPTLISFAGPTNATGWTQNWPAKAYCWYTATVPNPPQGYTCVEEGDDYNTGDQGYIYITCTPNEIPEFSLIGAGVAVVGGLVALVFLRKK